MKTLVGDYAARAQEIAAVRSELIGLESKRVAGEMPADTSARVVKLNEEVVRIACETTLPIAAELEALTSKASEFAAHRAVEESAAATHEMSVAERNSLLIAALVAVLLIGTSLFSVFTIARPMKALTAAMLELADGNFAIVLPGLLRKDEIGDVAAAVERFKIVSEQKAREEAETKIRQGQVEAEQRKAEMRRLADSFESAVGEIVETVSSASTELEASASTLTASAERTQEVTTMVAAASEEASTNVQSVASAT